MIKDRLENAGQYLALHEKFKESFAFIERAVRESLPVGKYILDGDALYASVQAYDAKEDGAFEAHRRYIDIQFIAVGSEKMEVADLTRVKASAAYDDTRDLALFEDGKHADTLTLTAGDFAILFPQDAHKPGLRADGEDAAVSKIVVKVRVQ